MEISSEISDVMDMLSEAIAHAPEMKESKWVKDMATRMRIFNTQIFQNVYEGHCKDNAEMNYRYMEKTFNRLSEKAYNDKSITHIKYFDFVDQYTHNINKLHTKQVKWEEKNESDKINNDIG